MAVFSRQLLQLVLQFLNEEKFEEAVHMLEQEAGLFFDMNYFERLMMAGDFDHADRYLSGFTKIHDDENSREIFLELRKQKYLEVLDRKDWFRAVEILRNDLKVFKQYSPEVHVQLMELLALNDLRKNEKVQDYSNDTIAQRTLAFLNIKSLIKGNPALQEKMTFPSIDKGRLTVLINQSINWQHTQCKSPRSNPDCPRTIFVDHTCGPPNGVRTPSPANNSLMASTSNRVAFPPIHRTYIPFQAGVAPPVNGLTGCPANLNLPLPLGAVATAAVVSNKNTGLLDAALKRRCAPKATKGGSDCAYITKRFRPSEIDKVPTMNLMDAVGHGAGALEISKRVLRKTLVTTVDSDTIGGIKKNIPEGTNKSNNSKFAEVKYPMHCRSMKLQDPLSTEKIVRLQYTYSGAWLFALDTNGKHKLWKWTGDNCVATLRFPPHLWTPALGYDMRNHTTDRSPGEINHCMALTNNDSYLASCSGGKTCFFNLKTFEMMLTLAAPLAATFLAFYPKDSNLIAMGMEDGTVLIFNWGTNKMRAKLKGHESRITGLAFSENLNVLVSSGMDAQLCVWRIDTWKKQKSESVHSKKEISPSSLGNTTVQFHIDQVHLLVVQDNQVAIYDACQLERLCQWSPKYLMSAPISGATYSCDCSLVYASFCDGSICVLDANVLKPCRRFAFSTFMPGVTSGNRYPLVIAANPREPNQLAIGLTDGSVHVIEPAESEGKWGVGPSENRVSS